MQRALVLAGSIVAIGAGATGALADSTPIGQLPAGPKSDTSAKALESRRFRIHVC